MVVLILLYGCTTWTLTKCIEEKLDGNSWRMLRVIWNKSWKQHPKKQQLYGHLPPISKTVQIRWTKPAWHWWKSKDKLISDVFLWTPSHGRAKFDRPTRTCQQQFCMDTRSCLEDLPWVVDDKDEWWKRGPGKSVLAVWNYLIDYELDENTLNQWMVFQY